MTKKQSTKKIRLYILGAVFILSLGFIAFRSQFNPGDIISLTNGKQSEFGKGQDDILGVEGEYEEPDESKDLAKEQASIKDSEKGNNKYNSESTKTTNKGSDKDIETENKDSNKNINKGKGGSKESEKDTLKDSGKVPSKDYNKDSLKTSNKESSKDSNKDTSINTNKESSKDSSKVPLKEPTKETSKSPNKAPSKDNEESYHEEPEYDYEDDFEDEKEESDSKGSSTQNNKLAAFKDKSKPPSKPTVQKLDPSKLKKPVMQASMSSSMSFATSYNDQYLGGTKEVDPEEMEINGSIYEEEGDEEILKNKENSKIGDVEHEDTYGYNPKSKQGYGRLGVPKPDKYGKGLAKTVTTESKKYPDISKDLTKIKPLNFRIYSHNVKNGGHEKLVPGEEPWNDRFRKITNSIKFNCQYNSIVTLQEVYKFQMLDIMDDLNKYSSEKTPEWSYYAAGRIDGDEIGEFVPILYKNSDWVRVFSDTIWLNDKNERMSLEGWDAKYLRILTYVTLKHKETGNYVNVFNTHLDHHGRESRIGSAEVIINKMKTINPWPSFLSGDLNCDPSDPAYSVLTNALVDTSKSVTPFNKYGHIKSTVTGFEGEALVGNGQNIDYIFGPSYTEKVNFTPTCEAPKSGEDNLLLKVRYFGMLHSKFNGVYMSDHRPLVADFLFSNKC